MKRQHWVDISIIASRHMFKLPTLKIAYRLPLALTGSALAIGIGLGVASFIISSNTVGEMTRTKLETIVESRETALKNYFEGVKSDLFIEAQNPIAISGIKDLGSAWAQIEGNPEQILQNAYIGGNPYPLGERHLLKNAKTGNWYDSVHAKYHPYFTALLEQMGYYDIFLFDNNGQLLYTRKMILQPTSRLVAGAGHQAIWAKPFRPRPRCSKGNSSS
jgi:methyl-accepting chemotaxis protein